MNFRTMLDTLSRSSAQAVRTFDNTQGTAGTVKEYLYVETSIEHAFHQALEQVDSAAHILFLCGSSGDGKSEILIRSYARYQTRFQFHLDATHSFQPDKNAIQTLDDVFSRHKHQGQPC